VTYDVNIVKKGDKRKWHNFIIR